MLKMTLLFSLALNRPITKKKDTAVTALYNVQQKETGNLSFPFPSSQLAGKKEKKKNSIICRNKNKSSTATESSFYLRTHKALGGIHPTPACDNRCFYQRESVCPTFQGHLSCSSSSAADPGQEQQQTAEWWCWGGGADKTFISRAKQGDQSGCKSHHGVA